jgi:hypothetical protein
MKRFKSMVVAGFAVLIAAAYVLPALPAHAVSSAALSIVPKKNYTIEAGKSIKDKLVIRNLDSKEPLQLSLRVVDFTFTDDGGTPKLFLAEDAPQTTWSLKPFLTIPKNVTVKPNGSESVDMSVAVPKGHGAGSYYSAIVYSSGSSEGGNVGLSASGVTLVFTSIPGKVSEDLKLEKFGAYAGKTGQKPDYKFITADMPEMMAYTLNNKGNVTESPVGSISLKDMWGHEYSIDDVNPNKSLALIGQTRTFTACIKLKVNQIELGGGTTQSTECTGPGLWPGLYTASLDVFYGQNGNNTQEITKVTHFLYLPWWALVILIIILAVVAYYVWRIIRRVKYGRPGPRTKAPRRR